MSNERYSLIFWCGYVCNKDGEVVVKNDIKKEEFDIDNGYDEEEILDILDLEVGCEKKLSGIFEVMSVYRYK